MAEEVTRESVQKMKALLDGDQKPMIFSVPLIMSILEKALEWEFRMTLAESVAERAREAGRKWSGFVPQGHASENVQKVIAAIIYGEVE